MNVLVINGSPRKSGTTSVIAKAFAGGAAESGADVRMHYLNAYS